MGLGGASIFLSAGLIFQIRGLSDVGERLRFIRRFRIARAAGFGKKVVLLWRHWILGRPANRPDLVEGFRKNRRLHDGREGGQGGIRGVRRSWRAQIFGMFHTAGVDWAEMTAPLGASRRSELFSMASMGLR